MHSPLLGIAINVGETTKTWLYLVYISPVIVFYTASDVNLGSGLGMRLPTCSYIVYHHTNCGTIKSILLPADTGRTS